MMTAAAGLSVMIAGAGGWSMIAARRSADMGGPDPARRTRAIGIRDRVLTYLADGEVSDPKGMAAAALADGVGYPGSSAAFAQLLSGMERSGLIERQIRGKRTYRIAAVAGRSAQPGRAIPGKTARRATRSGQAARRGAAAVLAGPEGGRHPAAEDPGDFDY